MTLIQLKYINEVTNTGSINGAAKKLFVSQSSISIAIRELEDELGISIFTRNNKGVELTREGRRFVELIAPIIEQEHKVLKAYSSGKTTQSYRLHVSSQHYPFVVKAFAQALAQAPKGRYDMQLKEANPHFIIEAVASGESDLGVMFISNSISKFIGRILDSRGLSFSELKTVKPHAYFRRGHPLACFDAIDASQLKPYPYTMFDRDSSASPNFSEEVVLDDFEPSGMLISISDRCTMYSILNNSDAFSIGSGLLPEGFSDPNIVSVPILSPDLVHIGWIARAGSPVSAPAKDFIELLKGCI